jgi:hypothetical protein
MHIKLLHYSALCSKFIGEYTESPKESSSNMLCCEPLPFHTPALSKFPFKLKNLSYILPPFSRTILFHHNDRDDKRPFGYYYAASCNNTNYAVTKFRLSFEIQWRISKNFDREIMEQINEPTSSISYSPVTKILFYH